MDPHHSVVRANIVGINGGRQVLHALASIRSYHGLPIDRFLYYHRFTHFAFRDLARYRHSTHTNLNGIFTRRRCHVMEFSFTRDQDVGTTFARRFRHRLRAFLLAIDSANMRIFFTRRFARHGITFRTNAQEAGASRFLQLARGVYHTLRYLFNIRNGRVVTAALC